jgi:hypothetical protein
MQVEPLYTVQQVAELCHVPVSTVRKLFRGRAGIVTLTGPGKPAWRIPLSLVMAVLVENGYIPPDEMKKEA